MNNARWRLFCVKFLFVALLLGFWGTRPPTARNWYEGTNIPSGFTRTTTPKPGDVISNGSHAGIVSNTNRTISATPGNGVVENDWGFRNINTNIIFYRYTE